MALVKDPDFANFKGLPEHELWEAFRNGNKIALEIIYRNHVNELFIYGMKIKGHDNLIKDCIQELFIELWNSKENLSPTTNVKFYLLRALKYKINHHLKKELKNFTSDFHYFQKKTENSFESAIIDQCNIEEKEKMIRSLITRLPSRQREIIHLLFFQEMSYEKISEIMEINVRSVYTLAWKAINFLRNNIK